MRIGDYDGHLALGWLGEPAFAHLVEPPLEALIGNFAPTASHGIAVGISFAIITTLHIVIGELAPKGLALQAPEGTSLWVARPLQVFEVIFRWPIALLNSAGNGVLKLFGLHAAAGHEMTHSVEELRVASVRLLPLVDAVPTPLRSTHACRRRLGATRAVASAFRGRCDRRGALDPLSPPRPSRGCLGHLGVSGLLPHDGEQVVQAKGLAHHGLNAWSGCKSEQR